jgi:hypothetical protein
VTNKYAPTDEHDELVQLHIFVLNSPFNYVANAVRWFERSTDDEIRSLLERERDGKGHFTGEAAKVVALELESPTNDIGLVLAVHRHNRLDYTVIIDKLTTSRWIRKHRPQLMGFLVPPELLRSFPAVVGEQPGVLFLDDMSSVIWDEATRVVQHFNFENELVREWKPGDEDYESILDLFVQFPLPRGN